MKISMDQLKKLRDMTLAPMKDCKDALVAAEWDFDKAVELLKEKWILKAGKKAGRETNEGLVKFITEWDFTVGAKLLCETDFVAKNDNFHALLDTILSKLLANGQVIDKMEDTDETFLTELNTLVAEFVWKMWENVQLGDLMTTKEKVFVYNHPGNKVATLIFYTGDDDVAKEVALQVAAMNPKYLSVQDVPEDMRKEMSDAFRKELVESGKPENIVEQILAWKIQKALSEFVLLEQDYIRDGSKTVKDILPEGFVVSNYIRFNI